MERSDPGNVIYHIHFHGDVQNVGTVGGDRNISHIGNYELRENYHVFFSSPNIF